MKIFITILIIFTLLLSGCAINKYQSFSDICKIDSSKITKVFFRADNGDSASVTDKAKIKEFLTILDGIKFSKVKDQTPRGGYLLSADIYYSSGKVFNITFGGTLININDVYYHAIPDISERLMKFYNSNKIDHYNQS